MDNKCILKKIVIYKIIIYRIINAQYQMNTLLF